MNVKTRSNAMRGSRALRLAQSQRQALRDRAEEVSARLIGEGRGNILRGFKAILVCSQASINMSMPKLIRFLSTGRWLNIYEVVAQKTGLKGQELEREVIEQLREYGEPRVAIDRLFRFPRDTHYAALNLGGPGPYSEYGACCVVFDLSHWAPAYTCFAGDSIHACFDAQGNLVLAGENVLSRFAASEDLGHLATVKHESFLMDHHFCVDLTRVRRLIEGEDTLIEVHLFGNITRAQIAEVRLPGVFHERLCELTRTLARNPTSTAQELDRARVFLSLVEALDRHEIPLLVCGDS